MVQKSKPTLWRHPLGFLARADVFFVLLGWLMVILVVGTLAQASIGLYLSLQQYFYAWVWWVGGVPLPGGATTLALITLGLAVKLVRQRWRWRKLGTLLTHLGVLALLVGGFVMTLWTTEGNILLAEGEQTDFMEAPYRVELALTDTATGQDVAIFPQRVLASGATLTHPALPFSLQLQTYCRNCTLQRLATPRANPAARGLALNFELLPARWRPREEENIAGAIFRITGAEEADGLYGVFEFMPIPQTLKAGPYTYLVAMRAQRIPLPFSVQLVDFEKDTYPGTATARAYRSDVIVTDGAVQWPARISMNKPLRYKGYTLYQASFVEGAQDVSILAVVENRGRLFPYLSTFIIGLGLLVYLWQRLPGLWRP
jgi:hypothetical protein